MYAKDYLRVDACVSVYHLDGGAITVVVHPFECGPDVCRSAQWFKQVSRDRAASLLREVRHMCPSPWPVQEYELEDTFAVCTRRMFDSSADDLYLEQVRDNPPDEWKNWEVTEDTDQVHVLWEGGGRAVAALELVRMRETLPLKMWEPGVEEIYWHIQHSDVPSSNGDDLPF